MRCIFTVSVLFLHIFLNSQDAGQIFCVQVFQIKELWRQVMGSEMELALPVKTSIDHHDVA